MPRRHNIVDTELYDQIVAAAKELYKWPSPGASAWVVNQYRQAGGRYYCNKPEGGAGVRRALSQATLYWPSKQAVHAPIVPPRATIGIMDY